MKILITEDDIAIQELIKHVIEGWGYDVDIAYDGEGALKRGRAIQYDLCIMDIDMPIMNGIEATESIRKNLSYFPIIAVSGNPRSKKGLR